MFRKMNRYRLGVLLGFLGGGISFLYAVAAFVYSIITPALDGTRISYFVGLFICALVNVGTIMAYKGHKKGGAALMILFSLTGFVVFGGFIMVLLGLGTQLIYPSVSGWVLLSSIGGLIILSASSVSKKVNVIED